MLCEEQQQILLLVIASFEIAISIVLIMYACMNKWIFRYQYHCYAMHSAMHCLLLPTTVLYDTVQYHTLQEHVQSSTG